MELGGGFRCKANSRKSESRKGPSTSNGDMPQMKVRKMLSGSTWNMSRPGIL